MRLHSKIGFVVFAVLFAASLVMTGCDRKDDQAPTEQGKIDFITDYDAALAAAQQKDQKILIDFYTDWCTWCKTLDTITYIDSSVIEFSKTIVFAKIDAEVDTLLAQKYSVSGFPTIVLINADGTEIDRIGGYLPPVEFIETVNNYLHDRETLNDYLRRADTNATPEVNYVLGEKYGDRGMYDKALGYYDKVVKADPKLKDSLTADAMLSIGGAWLRQKEYNKAIGQFKKVLKAFKGKEDTGELLADTELWLAYAYTKKADTTSALKVYERFLKNYPESPDTSYARKRIEKLKNPPPPDEG